jgi:asparagine synthase (glutamine-hydrolysing)
VSKFCGIYDFDARTPSSEGEDRVRTALDSPGCFNPQTCRQTGLLLGWAGAAESPEGRGLFQSPDGSICLWDGRIDNRKDILDQTGLHTDCSDAELALLGYWKSGADFFRHVIGDWSLCIWDSHRRRIVLASDYAGIRPLYYYCGTQTLYWSSSLADLVRWTSVTELDDRYVAGFLGMGSATGRTPYAGIFPVPAGHALSIGGGGIADQAFWTLPIHEEIRYRNERQYEERLLELFREAVEVRLPPGMPACAELSGGLDSSSVVCMADRLRRENPGRTPELITFSYLQANSPDERFFREVEQVCGVTACHLELSEHRAVGDRMGTLPAYWEPRYASLAQRMSALGSGVLLTGQFGDFIMGNTHDDTDQVTEYLARGQFVSAARSAYAWARAIETPIYPILGRAIREAYFSWVPPIRPEASVGAAPVSSEDSLTGSFRARMADEDRELTAENSIRDAPPGRRSRFRLAAAVLQSRRLQAPEALQHISYAHPYAHRPLVEFMLTIPAHIVVAPDQPRRLMRRAFAGLLPPAVLNRRSKGSYTPAYREAFLPSAAALLKSPGRIQVVERGYVERQSLMSRLEKFTQGLDCNETQLRQILLLEFWLRARMGAPSSSPPLPHRPEMAVS